MHLKDVGMKQPEVNLSQKQEGSQALQYFGSGTVFYAEKQGELSRVYKTDQKL